MMMVLTWLVRYGHVAAGAVWVGGYAVMALVIVPLMTQHTHPALTQLAITSVRVMTYAGTLTIGFGIALITRSRGFGSLFSGEWGALVLACAGIAIALLGLGDGALRPALRHLAATGDGRAARRYAMLGLVLTIVAVGLMTRTIYARS